MTASTLTDQENLVHWKETEMVLPPAPHLPVGVFCPGLRSPLKVAGSGLGEAAAHAVSLTAGYSFRTR